MTAVETQYEAKTGLAPSVFVCSAEEGASLITE